MITPVISIADRCMELGSSTLPHNHHYIMHYTNMMR